MRRVRTGTLPAAVQRRLTPAIVAVAVALALSFPGLGGTRAVAEPGSATGPSTDPASRSAAPAAQATPDDEAPPWEGDQAPEAATVLVTFETAEGTFRSVIEGPRDIAVARESLTTGCQAGIPLGDLLPGDGGINAPHAWHQVGTTFVDLTVELCDASAPASVRPTIPTRTAAARR